MASGSQDGRADVAPLDGARVPSTYIFKHGTIFRKSERTFQLRDPTGDQVFDVGQIKQFVLFDRYLRGRQGLGFEPVPSGYSHFAAKYNEDALGPNRFATFYLIGATPVVKHNGPPVSWDLFGVDDSLVGWERPTDEVEDTASVSSGRAFKHRRELEEVSTTLRVRIKLLHTLNAFLNTKALLDSRHGSGLTKISSTLSEAIDSIPEFANAFFSLLGETKSQANSHTTEASKIRLELLPGTVSMIQKSEAFLEKGLVPVLANLSSSSYKPDVNIDNLLVVYRRLECAQLEHIKDTLWAYANLVSTTCVSDDEASERLRLALEEFEVPTADAPYVWDAPLDLKSSSSSSMCSHQANSSKHPFVCGTDPEGSARPLPNTEEMDSKANSHRVLFYVKALYDYKAVAPEEFDFKKDDVIAVFETVESGWWTGEPVLNDGSSKAGSKIFPSNYVILL